MKIIIALSVLLIITACSTSYTTKELLSKANESTPYEKDITVGYFIVDKVDRISFDKKNQRVLISIKGKFENKATGYTKKCEKINLSLQPYLDENKFGIRKFKADAVNCVFGETIDTYITNTLKDIFVEDDLQIFELSDFQAWLVDNIKIEEDRIVINLSLF